MRQNSQPRPKRGFRSKTAAPTPKAPGLYGALGTAAQLPPTRLMPCHTRGAPVTFGFSVQRYADDSLEFIVADHYRLRGKFFLFYRDGKEDAGPSTVLHQLAASTVLHIETQGLF